MPTLSLSPSFFRQNRVFHWIPLDKIRKGSEKWNSSAPREVHVPRRCPRMSAWISLNDNNDLGGTRSDLKKKNGKRSITADAAKGGQVEGNFSAFTAAVSRRNSPCDWREKERQGELDGWFQIRDKKLLSKVFDLRYKFRIRSSQWTRARHTFTRAQTSERRGQKGRWNSMEAEISIASKIAGNIYPIVEKEVCVVHANRAMEFHFPRSPSFLTSAFPRWKRRLISFQLDGRHENLTSWFDVIRVT